MRVEKIGAHVTIATAVMLFCASAALHAQEAPPEKGLRIATGPTVGVYTQLAQDIQKVCRGSSHRFFSPTG